MTDTTDLRNSSTQPSCGPLVDQVIAFVRSLDQPAWLVGGYVRDLLLGRPNHDLDVIVPDGGVRLARAIAAAFDGASFVLDSQRDVGRALLQGEDGETLDVDVARLRVPELLDDLALRDFTINAIALNVAGAPEYFDPFDGRADLARNLLRAVTEGTFRDDPLRMLRGVRIAAELGFRIESATAGLIRRDAPLLRSVAPERVRDELLRILAVPGAWQHLRLLNGLGLLPYIWPESAAQIGITQSPPHYQDVFDHTRSVLAHLEGLYALLWPEGPYCLPRPVSGDPTVLAEAAQWASADAMLAPFGADLRRHLQLTLASGHTRRDLLPWAALAHDWGKPAKRAVDTAGKIRFFDHDHWGALLAEARTQALKLSSEEVTYVARLTDQHMRPGFLAHDFPPSRRAIYRFFREAETTGPDCVLLSLADHMATRAAEQAGEHWERRLATSRILLDAYFCQHVDLIAPPPLVNGHQLMIRLGLAPGPRVGELLEGLREAQAAGEVFTVDEAWAWLEAHAHSSLNAF